MGLELTQTEWSVSSVGTCLKLSIYISSQLILERSQLRLLLLFSFYMGKEVLKNLSEL